MVTISDIAKQSGVAKSTVSRFLNGGSVSETTKLKIESVINETGYIPNTFAQSLKAKRTNIIGTIVPRLNSFATSQTLIGIDEQLREYNCQMIISNTSQNLEREIENIYSFAKQKIAGIILLATQITEAHLEAARKVNIPILLVGQQHEAFYSLIHNDFDAGYDIGKYVLEKGHRKIAYLGVSEKDIAVGLKRKSGFQRAVSEHSDCEVHYYETSFKIGEAIKKVPSIIDSIQPTLFVCATDNIALGVLKAASLKGLNIPNDVSITGFGGYDMTEIVYPGITTIKFYYEEVGTKAAQMLMKLINDEKVDKTTILNYKIIERESVDNLSLSNL